MADCADRPERERRTSGRGDPLPEDAAWGGSMAVCWLKTLRFPDRGEPSLSESQVSSMKRFGRSHGAEEGSETGLLSGGSETRFFLVPGVPSP